MAIYPAWDQIYGIGLQAVWGTPVLAGANIVDTEGGVEVIGYPELTSGLEVIDTRKATGVPYRKTIEYLQGVKSPATTWDIEVSPRNIIPFLYSLFNTIAEGGSATYVKTFTIYASHPDFTGKLSLPFTVPGLLTLIRNIPVASEAHSISDAIVKSITFSSEQGQPLKASIEFIGTTLSTVYAISTGDFTFPSAQNTAIMFHDLYIQLDGTLNTADGTAVKANSFSITMSNNAVAKHQAGAGDQNVTGYILGDFTVTGSISIPWNLNSEIEKFTNGTAGRPTDTLIQICNESDYTCDGSGDFFLATNVRYTATPLGESDSEMTLDLSFEGVDDATNAVAKVQVADAGHWLP